MSQIEQFENRLKISAQMMIKSSITNCLIYLKNLQKDIRNYMQLLQIVENDRLSQMQITVYNNLACLYEKKGKYKSSLYHLEIAQKLENAYFTHKFNDQIIPLSAVEKLSTTYSNLSAVQSKLGNYKQAIKNVEFAIQLFRKDQQVIEHSSLVYLYYNYSMLLQNMARYNESSKYALDGLKIANKLASEIMIEKYHQLIDVLKVKLTKVEMKKEKQLRKYLKGQTGVIKKIESLSDLGVNFKTINQKKTQKQEIIPIVHSKDAVQLKKTTQQGAMTQFRTRAHSNYYSLKRNIQRSSSYNTTKIPPSVTKTQNRVSQTADVEFRHKTLTEDNAPSKSNTIKESYGLLTTKRSKMYSTMRDATSKIERRMKEKKRKMECDISELTRKNEILEEIMAKMYMTDKK